MNVRFSSTWPWERVHWQELWTVVQWEDDRGAWHDVAGWQGTLDRVVVDEDGTVVGRQMWWVARADLGEGPFRWRIYRRQGGGLLATSDPFDLPADDGEIVSVQVSLGVP